ncbi:Lectin receptor kinase [Quillaja saponaria]|uniref:non-specific serine/threonine protein kinase n=1 Tax=Quillaja saponaria TaxID=32244 RepID=A0AAD7VHG1_QUISA|nr:Lectin receptor kinase [Quillaja saponaria]
MSFTLVVKYQILAVIFATIALTPVDSFHFKFPSFQDENDPDIILSNNSRIFLDAIQVTPDARGVVLTNFSGRVFYKSSVQLWRNKKGKLEPATFNTTFVLNISPQTPTGGEGLAFVLSGDDTLPENSEGEWLGIVNATTNGTSEARVVAVEFDTRPSYPEDGVDNHVGVDVNSVYSIIQEPLIRYGVNLSTGMDVTVRIQYNQNLSVFVSMNGSTGEYMKTPVISVPINLSEYLPEKVFVGFSASTSIHTQLNCVKSWEFNSTDIVDEENQLLWVWITISAAVVILISGVGFFFYWRRKRSMEKPEDAYPRIEDQIKGSSMAPRKFRLKELKNATGNFNRKFKLGKGGFGTVYKGLLENKEVAVKRVSKNSRQGKQEFLAEVTTISSLHHKNLVKLIGWCYESRELLLVYEFMPNGSLDKYIFCDEKLGTVEQLPLNWETRCSVIHGVAQALDYLHNGCEKRVLHRDIKASNIMLDSEFNARLGDFGLARTIQKRDETHHSTNIAGTPGYMPPETFLTGRATVETDVFAFGVLVLEVVCGRKPGNQNEENNYNSSIVYWVWKLHSRGRILSAADPRMNGDLEQKELECLLILGLACCHPNLHKRPSMKTVLQVIVGEAAPPVVPTERPAFVWPAMPPSFKEDIENSLIGSQLTPFTEITGR